MKYLKPLHVVMVMTVFLLAIAVQQNANAQRPSQLVRCDALNGTPMMCIVNESDYAILEIQAGGDWIRIPGGAVPPGGMAIVKFPTWGSGCTKTVIVRTETGKSHGQPGVNVCQSTKFVIPKWAG
jgi:hypothetical protein